MPTNHHHTRLLLPPLLVALLSATLGACQHHPIKEVDLNSNTECVIAVDVTPNRDVDILFVIDNSASMGEEQALLSANFERFISALEAENVEANYRVAITTTDVGSSFYCPDNTPEDGAFVMSTCLDRLDEFVHDGLGIDKRAEACESLCPSEFAGAQPIATPLEPDGETRRRPWIQRINDGSNLPEGMSTAQAFRCFGPQGIAGCGMHESPLAAMERALARSEDPDDPAYGFLRPGALLAVVFITDENECSVSEGAHDIFDPADDRVFWEDPSAPAASSAVCWNAGVDCDGAGVCWSQDHGRDGAPTDDPTSAVLVPISTYATALAAAKGFGSPEDADTVFVSLIAGVPLDYPDAPIPYGDSPDPDVQGTYGVAPGCVGADGATATPPVRLKEFADRFVDTGGNNIFSVCADDYAPALDNLAERIRHELVPACMPACVADDGVADGLQTDCVLEEVWDGGKRELPRCVRSEGAWIPPSGEDACFHEATADSGLDPQCEELGANVEFRVERLPGTFARSGSEVRATCSLAEFPELDCPRLEDPCND